MAHCRVEPEAVSDRADALCVDDALQDLFFFFMWLRVLSSTVSQSPTVSFEVLLTLSQRAKLQMCLSCLFQTLHRIECASFFFFSVCALRVHLDTLSIWCLWRFP